LGTLTNLKGARMNQIVKTKAINGTAHVGDIVISSPEDEYPLLVGVITEIKPLGHPDRDTENDTDDVYVDFTAFPYSRAREKEIEAVFSELYQNPKLFEDLPLDMAIMDPESLLVLPQGCNIPDSLLNSEKSAEEFFLNLLK